MLREVAAPFSPSSLYLVSLNRLAFGSPRRHEAKTSRSMCNGD